MLIPWSVIFFRGVGSTTNQIFSLEVGKLLNPTKPTYRGWKDISPFGWMCRGFSPALGGFGGGLGWPVGWGEQPEPLWPLVWVRIGGDTDWMILDDWNTKKSSFHIFRGLFFKPRMFEMAMARSFGSEHAANSSYVLTIRLRQQSTSTGMHISRKDCSPKKSAFCTPSGWCEVRKNSRFQKVHPSSSVNIFRLDMLDACCFIRCFFCQIGLLKFRWYTS